MKQKLLLLLLFFPLWIYAQSDAEQLTPKQLRKARPVYLDIAMGFNNSVYRDFATSPLFYQGLPFYVSLGRLRMDNKRETQFSLSYSFGTYINKTNNMYAESRVNTFSINYSRLFNLPGLSSTRTNVMVGGLFNSTANLRINEQLQNNAVGVEMIGTLFGSAKVAWDISRTTAKVQRFLFIKRHLQPRERHLSFRLNVGLINNSYRNGYVYTNHSSVLNDPSFFSDYKFSAFSGFRFNSALDYTIKLKSQNSISLSYLWDAYRTGGDLDVFEMSSHVFKISFLFRTK